MLKILKHKLEHGGHEHTNGGGGHSHEHGHTLQSDDISMTEGLIRFFIDLDEKGQYKNAGIQSVEANRDVEGNVVGHTLEEAVLQTMRICGVCPYPYANAGLQAGEGLFGVEIPRKAYLLRKLGLYANHANSHILHAVALVMPKLAGVDSIEDVAKAYPAEGRRLFGLHGIANKLAKLAMGREVHALNMVVGGVSSTPPKAELRKIRQQLIDSMGEYKFLAELYASMAKDQPDWNFPKREFVALKTRDGDYPLFEGDVHTSKCDFLTPKQFAQEYICESYKPYSNAKHVSTINSEYYTVGALARLNLNGHLLHDDSKALLDIVGINLPCHNTMHNTAAQIVELPHIAHKMVQLIDELVEMPKDELIRVHIDQIPGYGVGVLEAPRGLILNEYKLRRNPDGQIMVAKANYVIPTGMNVASMEADIKLIAKTMLDRGDSPEAVMWACEMLISHYDTCNSCAVHMTRLLVEFIMKYIDVH